MNLIKSIILICFLSFPVSLAAQEKHPIAVAMEKCLATAKATMPRAECYSTASEAWQKAVKDDFQKLLKQLSPELQTIVKNEQDAWGKYCDQRQQFVMAKYGSRKGTGYIAVRIIELMKPFKERAVELENRLEN